MTARVLLAVGAWVLGSMPLVARGAEVRSVVELVVDRSVDAPLPDTLAELLGRVHLSLRASTGDAPVEGDTLARVTIDEPPGGEVRVRVADARDGHLTLDRRLPPQPPSSLRAEEIALVVRSGLDSLLEAPPAAPVALPPTPPDTASPGAPMAWALRLGGFASGRTFASSPAALGGGGLESQLDLGSSPWRPALWFDAALDASATTRTGDTELSVTAATARLGVSVAPVTGERFLLDVGVGAGIGVLGLSTRSLSPEVLAAPSSTRVDPLLAARAAGRFKVGASVSLFVAAGVGADLAPPSYVVADGKARDAVLEPATFAGDLAVGLDVELARGGAPR